ncbi:MAG: hypothetical protein IAA97_04485 [Spirochaetes bacterium]|uniref:Right-handed parallel beta-helix repeat-containing protein n=1 Tax=Candidatus Ornithospirochaeta stercoripullorum TaxID=2840899 RepID=A0A9D9E106_9SPIO|nr:hypothetical protein [Candidatus Ornithospirochaeta stercoripullorum]
MKKLFLFVLAILLCFTSCNNRTPDWILPPDIIHPDDDSEPCRHLDLEATDWFDAEHHYPKTGVCVECGETVTRNAIGISDADDLMQLASDINAIKDIGCTDVEILNDIDMTDKKWIPIIIANGFSENLTINGNDYTIRNLKTTSTDPDSRVGFFGELANTSMNLVVKNLTLNAEFTGGSGDLVMVGGFAGYIISANSVDFVNCHLESSMIVSDEYAGGIYAWAGASVETTINIDGCSVNYCSISSGGSVGGIVGHASANPNTTLNIRNSSVENSSITCTETGSTDKAGNIIGTVNCAKTSLNNVSYKENTVVSDGVTTTRCVGRLAFANGGSLSIDGRNNITVAE